VSFAFASMTAKRYQPPMRTIAAAVIAVTFAACGTDDGIDDGAPDAAAPADAGLEDQVTLVETYDVSEHNVDLATDQPTANVAFYLTESGPLTWPQVEPMIRRAKEIFSNAGVQLLVHAAMRLTVPKDWQALDADLSDAPTTPAFLETDLYAHLNELQSRLTLRNRAIFEAIVSHYEEPASGIPVTATVHVIALNEVPINYFEWSGSEWTEGSVLTGGLSFPPYAYADRIRDEIRGVITLSSTPSPFDRLTRVLAHELGHKLINVSHEGIGVCPSFEADGDDLMLYGNGERIAPGAGGRYHLERLLLSPFLHTAPSGVAEFANHFEDGGIYRDRLYGELVVDPPCVP
jgi:hypothetical protein